MSMNSEDVQRDRNKTSQYRQKAETVNAQKILLKSTQNYQISKIFFANLNFRARKRTAYCDGHTDKVVYTFNRAFG